MINDCSFWFNQLILPKQSLFIIVLHAAGSESLLADEDEDNVLYIFSIKSEKSVFSGLFSISL